MSAPLGAWNRPRVRGAGPAIPPAPLHPFARVQLSVTFRLVTSTAYNRSSGWAALALASTPLTAQAAQGTSVLSGLLMLPFMLALAVAGHVLLGRGAKAVAAAASPLASGEPEVGGYERRVYGTAERAMLEVVGLVLASGLVMWVGMAWGIGWVGAIGFLMLLGAVGLDMYRWERVTVSASYVWFQRGFGQTVHQVAIENIRDVSVSEAEAPGFTLRHLNRNRVCRLSMRMNDKRVVALPKTDAQSDLEAVETAANHIRTRQQLIGDRHAVKRSSDLGSQVAAAVAEQPASVEREMMRELKRLRQKATAPDLPPAVKPARKA